MHSRRVAGCRFESESLALPVPSASGPGPALAGVTGICQCRDRAGPCRHRVQHAALDSSPEGHRRRSESSTVLRGSIMMKYVLQHMRAAGRIK